MGDLGATQISKSFSLLSSLSLTELNLEDCDIGDNGIRSLCESLHYNSILHVLILKANRKVTSQGFDCIASLLEINNSIKTIDISQNNLGLSSFIAVLRSLQRNSARVPTSLSVAYSGIEDSTGLIIKIVSKLMNNQRY